MTGAPVGTPFIDDADGLRRSGRQCHPLRVANGRGGWKLKLTMAGRSGQDPRTHLCTGDAGAAHTGDMGRKIGTILGVILAIWVAFMAAGWIFAMVKTFLIIGLIAVVVFIIVSLAAGRPRHS